MIRHHHGACGGSRHAVEDGRGHFGGCSPLKNSSRYRRINSMISSGKQNDFICAGLLKQLCRVATTTSLIQQEGKTNLITHDDKLKLYMTKSWMKSLQLTVHDSAERRGRSLKSSRQTFRSETTPSPSDPADVGESNQQGASKFSLSMKT